MCSLLVSWEFSEFPTCRAPSRFQRVRHPQKTRKAVLEGAQAAGKRPWTPGRRGFQRRTQARSGIKGQFPTSHSPARVRPGPPGERRHAAGRPNRAKRTDCPMETRSPKPSSLLNCSGFEGERTGFQSTGRSMGTMRSLAEACWASTHSDPLGLPTVRSGAEGVRFRRAHGALKATGFKPRLCR